MGNTLEPPCGEGCWGGVASQNLINAVTNAGFNTIRIPCAWDSHANQSTYQIDPTYMARVKQVVDWCIADNLYVIINDHWDNGWLENHIGTSVDPTINAKMGSYWTQIANTFAGYDNHLLFAGANEPNVSTAGQMSTLMTYYNTFISAVRSTGGNNTNRWLVVQGPSTDIDTTYSLMNALPTDPTPGRLMVEIHYYTPWNFCGLTSDAVWGKMFYFWGAAYHSATLPGRNPDWNCEESYLDGEFQKMTTKFVNVGIPVMLGEFGSVKRTTPSYPDLTGANVNLHLASRTYFDWYVVDSAHRHGLSPFYWDTPGGGQLFNWNTGAVSDPDGVRALTGGAALPPSSNTPPVLANISNYTVNVGQTVAFTASATDTDQPPQTLTFSLLSAPPNATLSTNTGFFSWRPLVSQANTTNSFSLAVADNGSPHLSATQSFTVTVNPLILPTTLPGGWSNGQFTVQVSGQSGPDYAVLGSTNLIDWSLLFTANSPPLPFEWVDSNAAAVPLQFYRIQVGPPLP